MTFIFSSTKRLFLFSICIFVILCLTIHVAADDSIISLALSPFSQEFQDHFFPMPNTIEIENVETLVSPNSHLILIVTSSDQREAHDALLQGFKNAVRETPNVRYVIEHIDSVEMQLNPETYLPMVYGIFTSRYSTDLDLIVVIGESPYEFIIQHHKTLFPGIPFLTSTLSIPDVSAISGFVTGYSRYPTIAQTIDIAQKINPSLSKIYVLTPQSLEGVEFTNEIMSIAKRSSDIEYIIAPHDQNPQELIASIQSLGTDAAVFLDNYHFSAEAGNRYSIGEILPDIARQISVPIYTVTDRHNEDGVLGGYQISLFTMGEKIGTSAVSLLEGNFASIMPIGIEMGTPVIVYERMQAFGVSESVLPFDTIFSGKPVENILELSFEMRNLFFVFGITLLMLIIILLLFGEKLRFANKASLREHDFQNDIISHLAFGFYVRDVQDEMRYLFFNPKMEEFTGEESKNVLGRTASVLGTPIDQEELCIETQNVVTYEMVVTHTGEMRILQYIIHPTIKDHTVINIRGHVLDVTERRMWELELYESLELFQTYFEKSLYAIGIIRTIQDENEMLCDFCFVDINSGFEELFSVLRNDVLDRNRCDTLSAYDAEDERYVWLMELLKMMAQTRTFRFENRKFGELYLSGSLFKFGEEEEYVGLVCVDTSSLVKMREDDAILFQHIQSTMYEIMQIRHEIMTAVVHIRELIYSEKEAMFGEMVTYQVSIIEDLLFQIDQDVVQSEKIQDFLEKHHGLDKCGESER